MGCLERTEFVNNGILVASKMSSSSCLFVLTTRIYMNSICLNITPKTRTLGNLLAKYLEISTKALKCVMGWKRQLRFTTGHPKGGWWACVHGLSLVWLHGQGLHSFGGGSAVWTLAPHFWGSAAVSVAILGIGVSGSCLAFSDMWAWSVGVLDTEAGLCYGGLLTSVRNAIRLS